VYYAFHDVGSLKTHPIPLGSTERKGPQQLMKTHLTHYAYELCPGVSCDQNGVGLATYSVSGIWPGCGREWFASAPSFLGILF
jgi:hypothetical protein